MNIRVGTNSFPTIIEARDEVPAIDAMLSDLCSASVALEDLTRTEDGLDQVRSNIGHFAPALLLLELVHNRMKGAAT